ncbi:hypothetical protein [Halocalculus aciditolerans]|uniref:Uncharacterized protein n=1 Tax=Halocalculus aciditolerans TaxID=1383812 RepID=A0A830FH18_9EURY|nr:hypothetical protein [Halocalculus aciditolerans]GGL51957.1 hypothetical protein GCM10009039_07760 [Halocalculus aciditolerans]
MASKYAPEETAGSTAMSDRTQWLVVAALVLATLLVPALVYLRAGGGIAVLGFPYIDTLVALPMIPALVLAAIGVWSAVR